MKNVNMKSITLSVMAASTMMLSGCAAVQTEVEHHNLTASSKMSSSIFLPPVAPKDKTIFVSVKNTSSEQDVGLKNQLVSQLESRGWKVTGDYTKAHDMVQVNILQAGKIKNPQSVLASLSNGFGGSLVGGLAGGIATDTDEGALVGGALGGAASFIGGMFVKDVTYSMITDIQVSAKAPKGTTVHNHTHAMLQEGSSTMQQQNYSTSGNWMKYRTRIVTYADKVNLNFAQAKPVIAHQMAQEISNIF